MYRKFDVTENLLFAQYFFLGSKHTRSMGVSTHFSSR
jgi:hypothetical protein